MCNAWNHPPGCTCGWGGDGHLGSRAGAYQPLPASPSYRFNPHYRTVSSFTNPNAHCPVCGASVFFYQSPHGGRVFFDELGPPWPKHPCTDNTPVAVASSLRPRLVPSSSPSQNLVNTTTNPTWMDAGWQPFFCERVVQATGDGGYCRLDGYIGDKCITLYLCARRFPEAALVHLKSPHINEYDVSLLWEEEGTKRFRTETFKAFSNPLEAGAWCARKQASKPRLLRAHEQARSRAFIKPQASKKQGGAHSGKPNGKNKPATTVSTLTKSRPNQPKRPHKVDKPPSPKEPQFTAMGLAFIKAREDKSKG